MKCDTAIDLVIDSLMAGPETASTRDLDAHLESCAVCAAEAVKLREVWSDLGRLRPPVVGSESLVRFGRQLERHRSASWRAIGLRAAAAVALLATGAVAGQFLGRDRSPAVVAVSAQAAEPEFLLLIRGVGLDAALPEDRLVAEYRQWAADVTERGQLVSAEKLVDDAGEWVSATPRARDEQVRAAVEGFFLVKARNYPEAVALAREHPHVAYGGTIEVRAIERP
ncbi:MAG TPA: hypothetical protein VGA37_05220 [Gemmatimonadales bacterium]